VADIALSAVVIQILLFLNRLPVWSCGSFTNHPAVTLDLLENSPDPVLITFFDKPAIVINKIIANKDTYFYNYFFLLMISSLIWIV